MNMAVIFVSELKGGGGGGKIYLIPTSFYNPKQRRIIKVRFNIWVKELNILVFKED